MCRFLVESSINESARLKNHVIGLVVVLLLAVDGQVGAQVAAQVGRGILEESPTIAETLQLITRTRLKLLFLTSKKAHSNTLQFYTPLVRDLSDLAEGLCLKTVFLRKSEQLTCLDLLFM